MPHTNWSAGTPAALRAKIRAALIAGTLPCIGSRVWAGEAPAGAHVCACCGLPIQAHAPQYEPREHLGFFAHLDCFNVWREESALMGKDDAEPSTTAAGA